ncbi:MAG: hypothetical protein ABI646_10725, partial [Acidobacteriota bacterium]
MFCNYLTVILVFVLLAAKMTWIENGLAAAITLAIAVAAIFTVSIALGRFALVAGIWLRIASSNKTIDRIAPFALLGLPDITPSSRL